MRRGARVRTPLQLELAMKLIPAMSGSIPDMKRLRDRCVDAGGTKTHLLVEEAELPKLSALLATDWAAMSDGAKIDLSGEACPACGCKAPLVAGACSDCGLQLED
jgi:hypothetical protein